MPCVGLGSPVAVQCSDSLIGSSLSSTESAQLDFDFFDDVALLADLQQDLDLELPDLEPTEAMSVPPTDDLWWGSLYAELAMDAPTTPLVACMSAASMVETNNLSPLLVEDVELLMTMMPNMPPPQPSSGEAGEGMDPSPFPRSSNVPRNAPPASPFASVSARSLRSATSSESSASPPQAQLSGGSGAAALRPAVDASRSSPCIPASDGSNPYDTSGSAPYSSSAPHSGSVHGDASFERRSGSSSDYRRQVLRGEAAVAATAAPPLLQPTEHSGSLGYVRRLLPVQQPAAWTAGSSPALQVSGGSAPRRASSHSGLGPILGHLAQFGQASGSSNSDPAGAATAAAAAAAAAGDRDSRKRRREDSSHDGGSAVAGDGLLEGQPELLQPLQPLMCGQHQPLLSVAMDTPAVPFVAPRPVRTSRVGTQQMLLLPHGQLTEVPSFPGYEPTLDAGQFAGDLEGLEEEEEDEESQGARPAKRRRVRSSAAGGVKKSSANKERLKRLRFNTLMNKLDDVVPSSVVNTVARRPKHVVLIDALNLIRRAMAIQQAKQAVAAGEPEPAARWSQPPASVAARVAASVAPGLRHRTAQVVAPQAQQSQPAPRMRVSVRREPSGNTVTIECGDHYVSDVFAVLIGQDCDIVAPAAAEPFGGGMPAPQAVMLPPHRATGSAAMRPPPRLPPLSSAAAAVVAARGSATAGRVADATGAAGTGFAALPPPVAALLHGPPVRRARPTADAAATAAAATAATAGTMRPWPPVSDRQWQ